MSAPQPQIPRLLGARKAGGPKPRRGGKRSDLQSPHTLRGGFGDVQAAKDILVQQTDSDANNSRLSAVTMGYLDDPFAREFVLNPTPPRRLPIINRGTYVRTTAVDRLVEAFVHNHRGMPVQIVSLGAGTDTRYWRLRLQHTHLRLLYHEIDFPAVSEQKLAAIRSSKGLSPRGSSFQILHHVTPELDPKKYMWGFFRDGPLRMEGYLFHPVDLRKPFRIDHLEQNVPTLLISECCLCYLGAVEAKNAIEYFTSLIPTLGIALYEPTNPTSEFGRQMFANLAMRGLYMPTVHEFPTLPKQVERLHQAGFTTAQTGANVLWLWKNWVSEEERQRISGLEMLDELEEWEMLAQHYTVVWGWRECEPTQGAFQGWVDACKGEIPYVEIEPQAETDEEEEAEGSSGSDSSDFSVDFSSDMWVPRGPGELAQSSGPAQPSDSCEPSGSGSSDAMVESVEGET